MTQIMPMPIYFGGGGGNPSPMGWVIMILLAFSFGQLLIFILKAGCGDIKTRKEFWHSLLWALIPFAQTIIAIVKFFKQLPK